MQTITRNQTGHRCGASHQRAKLSSEQVAQMRADYGTGRMSYERLAMIYGCGISTARDIVLYRTRWAG